jgi:predicted DNA-binding transcriptional regulator YafY
MPRSQEAIRQWQVLRSIAASRLGLTVAAMAEAQHVTARTIRRDLVALQEGRIPGVSRKARHAHGLEIDSHSLQGLDSGFTLIELCALYFSRATLECVAGASFHAELSQAFSRFDVASRPRCGNSSMASPRSLARSALPAVKRADASQRASVWPSCSTPVFTAARCACAIAR